MNKTRGLGFWILISIGILLSIMFLFGQTLSLFNYDLTVSLGLQESVEEVGEIGVAWAKGFAFGDTVLYLPLLLIGIIGLLKRKKWGVYSMFGSLAITVYWPIVSLFSIFAGKNNINLNPDKFISYSIILPLIAIYGLWGMWFLYRNRTDCSKIG
ncbi:hypothetical protein KAI68_03935 [bacterium]|nr:hypothetical protein [bacterium]